MPAAALASVLALVSSGACSSSEHLEVHADGGSDALGADGDAQTPFTESAMRAAAQAFNAKYCVAFEKWDPVYFRYTFGVMSRCMAAGGLVAIAADEARLPDEPDPGAPYAQRRFLDDLRAPYAYGSVLTPDTLRACADALDLSDLHAWVKFFREHVVPDACAPAFYGWLEKDEPCGAWNQCKSGLCLQADNVPPGACGRCVARADDDVECRVEACMPGSTCRAATPNGMTCTRYVDVDEPCTANGPGRLTLGSTPRPCHDNLVCVNGRCAIPPADGSCEPTVGCSFVPYLRSCSPAKKCVEMPFADRGQRCGPVPGALGGFVPCAYGSTCTQVDAPTDAGADSAAPPSPYYRCVGLFEDGHACVGSVEHDSSCKNPDSRCFHDICQRNGPAECTAPAVLP